MSKTDTDTSGNAILQDRRLSVRRTATASTTDSSGNTTTSTSGNTTTSTSGNTTTSTTGNESTNSLPVNIFDQIFTKSNIIIIVWFIGFYIVVSLIMGLTSTNYSLPNNRIVIATRMLDFVVLIGTVITIIVTYFYKTEPEKEKMVEDLYSGFTDSIDKPITMIVVGGFLVVLYMFVMLLGIPMDQNKPVTLGLLENFGWIYLSIVLIALFFKYVLQISIRDFLNKVFNNTWNKEDETAIAVEKTHTKEEVFNIANNIYTYDDAQAACKSFNGRLATYDEVETAYNDGGEWCNYGWSDNQSIYFPTQKKTWDNLQKTKNHKNDCGRPGVNGGFIANPNARFGVNCYGVKPKPSEKELAYMQTSKTKVVPKTPEEIVSNFKVEFFKKHKDDFLRLNSFNGSKWSEV